MVLESSKVLAKGLVEKLILPKIEKFEAAVKSFYDQNMIPRGEHFEEYLTRSYDKYSILNTLVFKNERRQLKELFIPLTLVNDSQLTAGSESHCIKSFPKELMKRYSRVLITDTAGMGKSTLSKFLFLDVIEKGIGIPVFIEMRRLSKERSILMEIHSQIDALNKSFDAGLLLEFINTGGFVFFLDGYDEVALSERAYVTADVQEFVSKSQRNTFIMTSRPEMALSSFGDFQSFRIRPLKKPEAYALLEKYDGHGPISTRLVQELKSGQFSAIDEFLNNPLLVSLLFAAYDYKQTIPLKKSIFYRQVYDAYFDSHDISKGDSYVHEKKSKLDTDEFGRVLRHMAYECLKLHKIEFDKDDILRIIGSAKGSCPDLDFKPSDFLSDLLSAVPLFCKDGQYYKWVHKSLQEYFAALFIYNDAKNAQDAILKAMLHSQNVERYTNLLDIYYDVDTWGFKEYIELPVLELYLNYYSENFFSSKGLPQQEIIERINHLFLREICILQTTEEEAMNPDSFQMVKARTDGLFKNDLQVVTFVSGIDLLLGTSRHPMLNVLTILVRRRPDLFKEYTQYRRPAPHLLPEGGVMYVNPHSVENDPEKYSDVNGYIAMEERGLFSRYLDFDACKKEVTDIRGFLKKREQTSNLVLGL